jgi:hypothetical protein
MLLGFSCDFNRMLKNIDWIRIKVFVVGIQAVPKEHKNNNCSCFAGYLYWELNSSSRASRTFVLGIFLSLIGDKVSAQFGYKIKNKSRKIWIF